MNDYMLSACESELTEDDDVAEELSVAGFRAAVVLPDVAFAGAGVVGGTTNDFAMGVLIDGLAAFKFALRLPFFSALAAFFFAFAACFFAFFSAVLSGFAVFFSALSISLVSFLANLSADFWMDFFIFFDAAPASPNLDSIELTISDVSDFCFAFFALFAIASIEKNLQINTLFLRQTKILC